jgi:hypothetical protein
LLLFLAPIVSTGAPQRILVRGLGVLIGLGAQPYPISAEHRFGATWLLASQFLVFPIGTFA